jgi:hypothetical protein
MPLYVPKSSAFPLDCHLIAAVPPEAKPQIFIYSLRGESEVHRK